MATREDPVGSHYFALEIDGVEVAHFRECSGIKTSAQVFEIEEGGVNGFVHKRAGQSRWENVRFRVATSTSHALFDWRERCRNEDLGFRMSGAVTVYDPAGKQVKRYDLVDVWPVSWKGPDLDSAQSQMAVEELEISHGGVRVG